MIFLFIGLDIFLGQFGSGKTLSVVNLTTDILENFPKCRLLSNFVIHNLKNESIVIDNCDDFLPKLIELLSKDNDNGTIVIIDEVGFFLSKLFNEVNSSNYNAFFTILAQLRKLHCLIIFTSQIWGKVPKVLRDYILLNGRIIQCKKLFNGFTYYRYYDMDTVKEDSKLHLSGDFKRTDFLIHSPELYTAYDSYAVVSGIKDLLKKG